MTDLLRDPLLVACALLVAILLIWAWCGGSRRNVVLSTAFLIAVLLHGHFADLGWYERYQTYLVIIGVYLAFQILADLTPTQFKTAAKLTLVLAIGVLSILRIDLTVSAPRASSNTYRQRYQLGRFFEQEYRNQAVATTELGYPSLFHEGPIVDLLGLGSHDVLDTIRGPGLNNDRVAEIFNSKNVRVFGILSEYPLRPAGWKQVGLWFVDERLVPGPYGRLLEFWAPPGHAAELRRKLKEFQPSLPDRVVVVYPKQVADDS